MAVNNSGRPPVNSLASDDQFGLADLGRIRDQYYTEPAAIRASRLRGERAENVISAINQAEADSPGMSSLPIFQKELLRNTRIRSNVNSRLNIYQESKQDRLNEQAVNMVGREFSTSSINSYVARHANSLDAQVAGMAMTGQGYAALGTQRTQIMNQMQGLRQDSMAAASSYIDQNGINKNSASVLQGGSEQMKELAKQLIPITLAMQQLKQQGLDPKGRQEELARIGNKASGILHSNQLQEDMQSKTGHFALSTSELKKKEAEAAERLIKALSALNNAAGKTTEELTDLNKNAETAAKDFKELNEARGAKGGNGDGNNKFDTVKLIAGTIMEALEIGTGLYQNVAIGQPLQMVANTASAANLENEKYNQWHAAMAGDMHERMNLNWKAAQGFGNTMGSNQNTVHNLRQTQALLGTTLGAAQVGVSVYNGVTSGAGAISGINPIEQGAQGAKTFVSGVASGISELAAQQRQTEIMALRLDGTRAYQHAKRALSKISGQQMQGFREHAMGINATAGAMGGEVGEAFINETGGADFLGRMSEAGIGVKEFGALSARGAQQMGSRFNKEQIFSAVNFERQGFGTADQNMQRIGMLSSAGQGDSAANLGKIIEEAMQRGLNSSKALDMIVENTARISEDAMMAGAIGDPMVGISSAILRAVDPNNSNGEQALKLAQQGYERGEGARRNIATSLPGLLNVDRTMKDFGVDRRSAMIMSNLSSAEILALKETGNKSEWLESQGVNTSSMDSSWFKGTNLSDKLDQNAAVSVLAGQSGLGYPLGDPGAYAAELRKNKGNEPILDALIWGKELSILTPEQRQLRVNQAATSKLSGVNPIVDMARAGVLTGALDEEVSNKTLASLNIESRKNLTDENRLPGKANSAQALEGAQAFGATAKIAMSALAESGRQAFATMGQHAEKEWTTAAQKTAENFGNSTTLMGNASSKLEAAAVKMTESTQLMAASGASFASAVSAAIAKIADKLGMLDSKKDNKPPLPERRWPQKGEY